MASRSPNSISGAPMSGSTTCSGEHRRSTDETPADRDLRSFPSMPPSASASRSRSSGTETKSAADEMLRASLFGGDVLPASSASVSRSRQQAEKNPVVDDTPRASVTRSVLSSGTSASVSRSALRNEDKSAVDDAPRSSLLGPVASSHSPASVSRSSLRGEKKPSNDDTLRRSLAAARGIPPESSSVFTTPPPLYSSKLTARPMAASAAAGRSTIVNSVKLQKAKLQEDIDKANAEATRRKTAGLFREACSTDLLFLIDTTSSMTPYLEAAKDQIRSIVSDIKTTFLNEPDVHIAVVSYKDHNDHPNIEFLDFTPSADAVRNFLANLYAEGGADMPEDILGGIQQALNATWKQQTRCIIHIADAPPHGSSNHDLGAYADSYHREGSEPHGLTYQPLFRKLVQLKINYALLRINYSTDRMALNFADVYGYDNAKLLATNNYYEQAKRSRADRSSKPVQAMQPQFEEQQLGTTYDQLRHLVVRAVTASVSRTAGRLTLALEREAPKTKLKLTSALSAIRESDDGYSVSRTRGGVTSSKVTSLETSPPKWDTPSWLDETLDVEGFCPAIVVHDAHTLSDMMFEDEKIKLSTTELTIYTRSKPFAQGGVRLAYYARSAASTSRFVVKSFIQAGYVYCGAKA